MQRSPQQPGLIAQLRSMLEMAGARPLPWISGIIAVSLILAALDTLGVAAMVPLTQLMTGASTDSGALKILADTFGTSDPAELIPIVALVVAGLFIGKSIAAIFFRWWLLGRTSKIAALSATELLRRYVLAPYADHRARRVSEVYRSINEATNQSASVLLALVSLVTDILVLTAIGAVLAVAASTVTVLTIAVFAVAVVGIQRLLRRRQSRIGEEMAAASLEAWSFLIPGLDGFREARLTSSASAFVEGFRKARLRSAHAARQMGIVAEAPRYVLEIGFIVAILVISVLLFTSSDPATAFTVLGVFAAASVRAIPTLNRVTGSLTTMRVGRVGLGIFTRAASELAAGGAHDEVPRSDERYAGDIAIRDLSFAYRGSDDPVLRDLTLTIAANRTTAFVGSSGAGKSTLVDLVLGLLEPTRGTIECGGRSILDDRAAWYSGLGVVPQDVFLVNDTLLANIAFGVPEADADLDRVHEVIRMAQLEEVVAGLPEGLHTTVGDRGVRLSGGQRQRVGLARALYRRPSVLVLDEATSALDNVTEHEIAMTLEGLKGTLTIIIVAHRLSTVRNADTLVFLQDGTISAKGRFDEVRRENADFARLVKLGELT
ncbi:ABC transporter ATP-binding protein [Microbacterium thalassium]|uniref:ABC-type multidrug transport system fused ATPase/permease subunit n=1 Tax=Microbacterium thalassium TaxID=362649 RepID=A0A7X0FLV8_9MICO|nr:ABC transporter ATP-binding protein [Microbacterium thalassium]MBB6389888.1 ABC-type multidrug transport system fused ATPase/permease subunit [Microbacterium thalassium]GLK24575.1 ABC transporter ATP-binding protein [Microbacterium thalassium]